MSKDVEIIETEDGTEYRFTQADFFLPDGRKDTAEEIEANAEAWWLYAAEEHKAPTIEERLTCAEEIIAMLLEG